MSVIESFNLDYPRTISGEQKTEALKKIYEIRDKIISQFFSDQEVNAPTFLSITDLVEHTADISLL